jgi:hypothetical protein
MTEPELLALFDVHDRLVVSALGGDISVEQFVDHYDNFPVAFALDGHESDDAGKALLARHSDRVRFHFGVVECLRGLCRADEIDKSGIRKAGGFGPAEAFVRLQKYCETWPKNPTTAAKRS